MRRKGFTLIELLVVIAIIAILAAILFPVFAQAREKARQTQCVSNMRQATTAARMYMEDFDQQSMYWLWYNRNNTGVWISWMEMLNPYVKNNDVFLCPSMSKNISSYTTGCTSAPDRVGRLGSLQLLGLVRSRDYVRGLPISLPRCHAVS